jgi:hypothetical protein
MYSFMATHGVGSLHVAPWGWRLLGPAIAPLIPRSFTVGFQVLAVGALSLTALGCTSSFEGLGLIVGSRSSGSSCSRQHSSSQHQMPSPSAFSRVIRIGDVLSNPCS